MITQTNKFASALQLARSEAIKRGARVTMCKSTDGNTCSSVSWEDGWIVFVDTGPSIGELDADEELLRVGSPAPEGIAIDTNNFEDSS